MQRDVLIAPSEPHPNDTYNAAEAAARVWERRFFFRVYWRSFPNNIDEARTFLNRRKAIEFAKKKSLDFSSVSRCTKYAFEFEGDTEIARPVGHIDIVCGRKRSIEGDTL